MDENNGERKGHGLITCYWLAELVISRNGTDAFAGATGCVITGSIFDAGSVWPCKLLFTVTLRTSAI